MGTYVTDKRCKNVEAGLIMRSTRREKMENIAEIIYASVAEIGYLGMEEKGGKEFTIVYYCEYE